MFQIRMMHAAGFKFKANFWHEVWYNTGCPSVGVLFQLKKSSNLSLGTKLQWLQVFTYNTIILFDHKINAVSYLELILLVYCLQ